MDSPFEDPSNTELLTFFKALADSTRLKIVGLLAERPLTVEQLAEMLHLRASTVSHHLSLLARAGLVSARAESYYNLYQLETEALQSMAARLLTPETLPAAAAGVDVGAYDRKVLADYSLPDGRLKTIPAQRKKREAVLKRIANDFKLGARYSESQVNEILGRYHEDIATLKRELVGYRQLSRTGDGMEYWRDE